MRSGTMLAAATALMTFAASTAHASEWCGYAARAKSVIECGYSTAADCENDTGKGGMCFVDPDLAALASKHANSPPTARRQPDCAS